MKISRIAHAVTYIDDDLITAAAQSKPKSKHTAWLQWGSFAACLAVLMIAVAAILYAMLGGEEPTGEGGAPNANDSRYKSFIVRSESAAIVWPWESRTVFEKYTELTLDGTAYRSRGRAVSEQWIGDLIGTRSVNGYDMITEAQYTENFQVYQLKYADQSQFVAVGMEGTFYVFKNSQYDPPDTLGALFALVDLPKVIELNRFSENGEAREHFALSNDDYVWEILADCKDAEFVEDGTWTAHDREYLSFTVTSEPLGVYKVVMYITADGYLWTNAFDYQYLFYIGDAASEMMIKYAKEHSSEVVYEPYQNTVVGKVVEITDAYILVDDSILCHDPADGITYKILLNDLRISRYVEARVITEGDTVQIVYEGRIDEANGNTVDSAISASKAVITNGDVLIPA
ncbi:MAG: hypothetical protein IKC31_02080 [Clostridia bacterium]|nr:hypothetical protein [Clostridia bacterium]